MVKNKYLYGIAFLALVSFVSLSACSEPGGPIISEVKMTGGGWIPSVSGNEKDKANFGFNAAKCDTAIPVVGHFNYHDKYAEGFQPQGVKMNGVITEVVLCVNTSPSNCMICPPNSFEAEIEYRSTNPKNKGEGVFFACVVDNGEGANAPDDDMGIIDVMSGPYAGYFNEGAVQGNIQFHTCTCTDGIDNDEDGLIDEGDDSCADPETGDFDPNADEE